MAWPSLSRDCPVCGYREGCGESSSRKLINQYLKFDLARIQEILSVPPVAGPGEPESKEVPAKTASEEGPANPAAPKVSNKVAPQRASAMLAAIRVMSQFQI